MLRRVGFVVAAPLLAAGALLMPQLVTATHSVPSAVEDPESPAAIDLFTAPRDAIEGETNDDEAIDVYGNRVTAAVATYKLDGTGTVRAAFAADATASLAVSEKLTITGSGNRVISSNLPINHPITRLLDYPIRTVESHYDGRVLNGSGFHATDDDVAVGTLLIIRSHRAAAEDVQDAAGAGSDRRVDAGDDRGIGNRVGGADRHETGRHRFV